MDSREMQITVGIFKNLYVLILEGDAYRKYLEISYYHL